MFSLHFLPITFLSLGSRLDMVLLGFYDFFSLFNDYLATSAKRLGGSIINVYRNYDGFCIRSALMFSAFSSNSN
jgi:hypothetical protein